MTDLPFGLEPDRRMSLFVGGFDPESGQPLPLTPDRLRRAADAWRTSPSTPDGIAGLLSTSRDLFVLSYFSYELLTVGVLVSLQAVEASLRTKLDSTKPLAHLIQRAESSGLVDPLAASQLDAGRKLRNDFSHPAEQTTWPFGMASGSIKVSHEMVARLSLCDPDRDTTSDACNANTRLS